MTTQLRTDIENVPTDGSVVIIGTLAGEIFMSRFLAPDKHKPQGRWSGLNAGSWPVAWAEVPTHPYFPDATKPLVTPEKVKP